MGGIFLRCGARRRRRVARPLRQELTQLGTIADVEAAMLAAAPGARALVPAAESELAALGAGDDGVELGLSVSVYGGG